MDVIAWLFVAALVFAVVAALYNREHPQCGECGKRIPRAAKVCAYCGTSV